MPSAWQISSSEPKDWRTTEGIQNLHLVHDIPKPKAESNSTLVRIKAAALNARDMMVVAHDPIYPIETLPGLVPCADGAGIVEEVGPGSKWKPGDRVLLTATSWVDGDVPTLVESAGLGAGAVHGTLREYAVVADDRLIRAPAHLTFAEMAALPAAAGTAINALFYGPQPFRHGMTVLTQGTGGVSACAIQIAAAAGATVVATSSSDEKLATARALGATHLINYSTTPAWSEEVLRVTGGKGVDHVLDVAGAGTIEQSLLAVKHGGLVSVIGFLTESQPTDLIPLLLFGAKSLRALFQVRNDMTEKMVQIYEKYQLRPPVAAVYKWEDAKEAFTALNAQSSIGKIVIEVGPSEASESQS